MKRYRIVTDSYAGFEVQAKRSWFPIWLQCSGRFCCINTHPTVEKAEQFARRHAAGGGRFVKDLGLLSSGDE